MSIVLWGLAAGIGVLDVYLIRDTYRTIKRIKGKDAARVKDTPHTVITDRNQFPDYARPHKCLKGIAIGACIKGFELDPAQELAHAHMHGKEKGWVCMRSELQGHKLALLHEIAHLMNSSFFGLFRVHHGKEWKKSVVQIGGTFEAFKIPAVGSWTRDFTAIETQDDEDRSNGIVKEPSAVEGTLALIEKLLRIKKGGA